MIPYPHLTAAIVCFIVGALLTASRTALVVLPDSDVKRMATGTKKEQRIAKLLAKPGMFQAATELGLLSFISAGAIGLWLGLQEFSFLRKLAALPGIASGLVALLLFIGSIILLNVFCYLLPARIGMRHAALLAPMLSPFAMFFIWILRPFFWLNRALAELLGRLFGVAPGEVPSYITEEEIRFMVDQGNEKGEIEKSEKEMINNIFEFDDRTVSEVMTHRTDLIAVPLEAPLEEIVSIARNSGYSRLPVYGNGVDDIEGILYVKDLLGLIGKHQENFSCKNYMRKVLFIPENVACIDLFAQFKQKKLQVAIAVDEYGGTAGLVTMEDLVESIVGNIQDEYDDEEEEIYQMSPDCYLLDGTISIDAVENLFDVELDGNEDSEYDTIGGRLTEILDRLPEPDEHPTVVMAGIVFTVVLVEERRIARIRAERQSPKTDTPETEKKEKG